ncbi:MAG: type IV secretory system conjugative DNA transfer family protein [Defluviitaleaceae bacterium]|nr:type IV secretory system conjugative DNA transfer family protein [Defluviitaleaceae bacterium]
MSAVHGFVFGKLGDKYVAKKENKDGHILIIGGAGSGKTSCIAIPSLLAWREPVFCIDIKGELYQHTKHKRPNARVFDPLSVTTYGYDPYYLLKSSDNPAQEARAIAQALVPLPTQTKDPFWIEMAQGIFTAVILHYSTQGLSFLETVEAMQSIAPTNLIQELRDSPAREVRYFVNSLADMDVRTLSSIMAELSKNTVSFVTDKNLIHALSRPKNITPDDLEYGMDVFLCIPEHLLRQWKNLLTLIVSQFLRHFEKRPNMTANPILFLLDEFPRLGKIEEITDGLATLRSKKITICLIIQSLAQLDLIYGVSARRVIADNCAFKAILNATDADSQEYFSRLVGTYEKTRTTHDMRFEPITGFVAGSGTSRTTEEKRTIKPENWATLKHIALFTPYGFFKVDKTPYWKGV